MIGLKSRAGISRADALGAMGSILVLFFSRSIGRPVPSWMVRWPRGVIVAVRLPCVSVAGGHSGSGSIVYWPGAGRVGCLSSGGHEIDGDEEGMDSVSAQSWEGRVWFAVARMRRACGPHGWI